jgi:hypothetical protein
MKIRSDFESASIYLERLLLYGNVFHENNNKNWPYLKNREDFRRVYAMDDETKYKFEKIYSVGRNLAIYMSDKLETFDSPAEYPTLTSYIKSFDKGWLNEREILQEISSQAKEQERILGDNCPWAVEQMIILFDKQIQLLENVAETLNILRTTEIYRVENGESVMQNGGAKIYNFSNIHNSALNVDSPSAIAYVGSTDIKNILAQLTDIFQEAQFSETHYQEQAIEILGSILDEIQKPKPKKLSIGAMVSTLSGLAAIATSIHANAPLLLERLKQLIQ